MDDLTKAIADSVASKSSEDEKNHLVEFLRPYIAILPISTGAIIDAGNELSELFGMKLADNLEELRQLFEQNLQSLQSAKSSSATALSANSLCTFNQDRRVESGVFSSDASLSANSPVEAENDQLRQENWYLRRDNEELNVRVSTLLARLGAVKHACSFEEY